MCFILATTREDFALLATDTRWTRYSAEGERLDHKDLGGKLVAFPGGFLSVVGDGLWARDFTARVQGDGVRGVADVDALCGEIPDATTVWVVHGGTDGLVMERWARADRGRHVAGPDKTLHGFVPPDGIEFEAARAIHEMIELRLGHDVAAQLHLVGCLGAYLHTLTPAVSSEVEVGVLYRTGQSQRMRAGAAELAMMG